jgi:hypothetical protein
MRVIVATVLATSLFVSSAFAATDSAPLAPGKPAGVKQADIEAGGVIMWLGIAAVCAGIAVLAAGTQGNSNGTTSTQ